MAAPDVCKTPSPAGPVPVPYPNQGMVPQSIMTSKKVFIAHKMVCTKKSKMPRSQLDEAGVAGGVKSGMNMGPVLYKKCSMKLLIEGMPTAHHLSMTGHNGVSANIPAGVQLAPSQTKVMIG